LIYTGRATAIRPQVPPARRAKILVKPQRGQIESELTPRVQSTGAAWCSSPRSASCQRLNITRTVYKSLIARGQRREDHVPAMNKLDGSRDLRVFDEHLRRSRALR
jgi:hypothetical protein